MKKRYGQLRISPWIVPHCISIGFVLLKYSPMKVVDGCDYMLPISLTKLCEYLELCIIANSLV